MSNVCVICREINKVCEHEKIRTGTKWAAPRKNNDKAWKLIESGDIWWDKRRVNKPSRAHGNKEYARSKLWWHELWRWPPEGIRFLQNHPKKRNKNA